MEFAPDASDKRTNVNDYYIPPSGPYGVGFRETVLEEGTRPTVSIFYPIDKTEYDTYKYDESRNLPFYLNGIKDLEGIKEGMGRDTPNSSPSNLVFRLHVLKDAELHEDFRDGDMKLTPVVKSHWLMSNRSSQAAFIYHLVSYGCIVYACTHTDGTATFFKNYQEDPPVDVIHNANFRHIPEDSNPVKHFGIKAAERMKDMDILIKFIKEEEAKQYPIDLNKLVATGHSLGGLTAIDTALKYPEDVKIWIVMDPAVRFRPHEVLETKEYVIKQPICIITTQKYIDKEDTKDGHTSEYVTNEFFKNTCAQNENNKNYNIVLSESGLLSQSELSIQMPEAFAGTTMIGKLEDVKEKYLQNTETILAYLDEHEFLPQPFGKKVEEISGIEILAVQPS